MLNKIKDAGLRFAYSEYAAVPEIPHVIDVLYAMKCSEEQYAYDFCVDNHPPYVENVELVIAAVAPCPEKDSDEQVARELIATAIVELCPDEAKCLFEGAFVDALKLVAVNTPDVVNMTREEQRAACGCTKCKKRAEKEREHDPNVFRPLSDPVDDDRCAPPGGTCWVTGLTDCDGSHP